MSMIDFKKHAANRDYASFEAAIKRRHELGQRFEQLPKLLFGCAYCDGKRFRAVRLDKRDSDSKHITCVHWCPDCGKEDWVMVEPEKLALAALILNSYMET